MQISTTMMRVTERWREPCENAFEFILQVDPEQLANLINSKVLRPGDLSFAAEILGQAQSSRLVRSTLLPLLEHPESVVREGAIYGLIPHLDSETVLRLSHVGRSDVSAGVRAAAKDAIK